MRGAVGADQIGEAGFDRGVALAQGVVVGIGDLRCVVLVIELVVARNLGGEARELGAGLVAAELFDGFGGGCCWGHKSNSNKIAPSTTGGSGEWVSSQP